MAYGPCKPRKLSRQREGREKAGPPKPPPLWACAVHASAQGREACPRHSCAARYVVASKEARLRLPPYQFSIISLMALAGRWITSPAAMRFTTVSSSRRITPAASDILAPQEPRTRRDARWTCRQPITTVLGADAIPFPLRTRPSPLPSTYTPFPAAAPFPSEGAVDWAACMSVKCLRSVGSRASWSLP